MSLSDGRELNESLSVAGQTDAIRSATFSEVGRVEDARYHFDALMVSPECDLPHDYAALIIPAIATRACARLRTQPELVDCTRCSSLTAVSSSTVDLSGSA